MKRNDPIGFTVAGIIAGVILLVIIITGYSRRIAGEDAIRQQRNELQRLSDSIDKARRLQLYGNDSLTKQPNINTIPSSQRNDTIKQ